MILEYQGVFFFATRTRVSSHPLLKAQAHVGRYELRRSSVILTASASIARGLICCFCVAFILSRTGSGVGETVSTCDSRHRGAACVGCFSFAAAALRVCWRRRGIMQYLVVVREQK